MQFSNNCDFNLKYSIVFQNDTKVADQHWSLLGFNTAQGKKFFDKVSNSAFQNSIIFLFSTSHNSCTESSSDINKFKKNPPFAYDLTNVNICKFLDYK